MPRWRSGQSNNQNDSNMRSDAAGLKSFLLLEKEGLTTPGKQIMGLSQQDTSFPKGNAGSKQPFLHLQSKWRHHLQQSFFKEK